MKYDITAEDRVVWRDQAGSHIGGHRVVALLDALEASEGQARRMANRLASIAVVQSDARLAVERVRMLADDADAGEGIVLYSGHREYHVVETGLLRAALDGGDS